MNENDNLTQMISANSIRAAAQRLEGKAIRTPLIENDVINEMVGARVLMKTETLQLGGSFKFRGAYNRLSKLTATERKRGVLAWSSGNHAQGVARAAKLFSMDAVIIMPADAPILKLEGVRKLGAEIVFYDRYSEDREAIGRQLAEERGFILAPSYDHYDIIEGQGTVALEALADAQALDSDIDEFVICCGGGGLAAGCSTLLAEASPDTKITIAEPTGFEESWASIRTGTRQFADITQKTICDAIATSTPGQLTLPILEKFVSGGAAVTESEVEFAIQTAFKHLKLVLEPGGAVALAAVLSGKTQNNGGIIAVTLSGGNIDPELYAQILKKNL